MILNISPEFAKALIKAQSEMENATKDSANPFFKSKYADLSSVREASLPALNKNGIAILQPTVKIDGKSFVKSLLVHENGEILDLNCDTEVLFNKPNDPQAQGSGITYARRYGLQSILTLAADDDDGNAAAKEKTSKPYKELANIADEVGQEMADLVENKKKEDAIKKGQAQLFAYNLKEEMAGCGSVEELEGLLEKKKDSIERLKQNYKAIFNDLDKSRLQTLCNLDPIRFTNAG